jgi:hypothetical protein
VNREFIGPGEIRATSDKWKMDYVYRFFDLPQDKTDGQFAEWQVSVAPSESREIRFLMHVVEPGKPGSSGLTSEWFETQWDRTKAEWENRWKSAFTPDNDFFSGNAPLLVTNDAAIREIYYRSMLTLLVLLRTNLWSNRTFITSGERTKGVVFYWDTSLFSTLFALLEPKQMKEQIKLFLEQDRTRTRLSFSKLNDLLRPSIWRFPPDGICADMRQTISPSSGWPGRISLSRRTRSSSGRRSPTRRCCNACTF